MPNAWSVQTQWTGQRGINPDNYNEALYAGGQPGQVLDYAGRTYQFVHHDSGATSATATGVAAAAQIAFWKDKANYLVTNDSTQAQGGQVANAYRNFVAGIYRTAVTANNYCFVLQRGIAVSVKQTSGGGVGQTCIANTGTAADATSIAVGTDINYQKLGVDRGASANNVISVDLDIPSAP